MKRKVVRANEAPFMNKEIKKVHHEKDTSKEYIFENTIRGNLCTRFIRRSKRNYYNNLDSTNLFDNKKFWNTVKPLFSEKTHTCHKITLIDDDNVVSDDKEIAEIVNEYLVHML